MKEIINNPNSIKNIDITTNKVRALIIDENDNILITKYADMYMLPGGKIEKGEKPICALIRELNEELGILFDKNEINEFITYNNYLSNYPIVDKNERKNKLNKTIYYIIKTNKEINKDNLLLTNREKENNFSIKKVNLEDAIKLINNYNSTNERNEYFKKEILDILNEYNKTIDMHTHSSYSDGSFTPDELINLAIKKNIGVLAITDHDSIEGLKNINKELLLNNSIDIINGIELSAKRDKGKMHILGLGIDIYNKSLNEKLEIFKDININYVLSFLEELKKDYKIYFSYKEIKDLVNSNHNLGRPDIAKMLVKRGYAKNIPDAFDKYLIDIYNKLGNRKKGIPYEECISLILESGGIPVLAHPNTLEINDKELLILLKDMIKCGLQGIEVYHSSHSKEDIEKYLKIASELNLLISGGSDYHGPSVKPNVELGSGINNNLKIKKLSILDKIKR